MYVQIDGEKNLIRDISTRAILNRDRAGLEEYKLRRDVIVSRLNKMKGVFCPNPGGAFYAMAKLPIDDSDKFCQWLLEEFNYNNQTVMLAPATGFYGTVGLGKQEVRLAYVLNTDAINNAMDCLEKALEVYPGRM